MTGCFGSCFFFTNLYAAMELLTLSPVFSISYNLLSTSFIRVSLSSSLNFQLSWDFLCLLASNLVLFIIKIYVHWLYSWSSEWLFSALFNFFFFFYLYQLLSSVPSILIHTSIAQMYHFPSKGSVYLPFFHSFRDTTMKYSQGYIQCYPFKNPNLGLFFYYLKL